jgi:hypothetical protein
MISTVGDAWGMRAARAGDAFQRGNQAFSCAPAVFPRLRLFLHHPTLLRFPAPLPAVFVHPLLVSLLRVVCSRVSPLAAAGGDDAGKEKRRNRKIRNWQRRRLQQSGRHVCRLEGRLNQIGRARSAPVSARSYGLLQSLTVGTLRHPPSMRAWPVTVAAVVCRTWQDITQAVGIH